MGGGSENRKQKTEARNRKQKTEKRCIAQLALSIDHAEVESKKQKRRTYTPSTSYQGGRSHSLSTCSYDREQTAKGNQKTQNRKQKTANRKHPQTTHGERWNHRDTAPAPEGTDRVGSHERRRRGGGKGGGRRNHDAMYHSTRKTKGLVVVHIKPQRPRALLDRVAKLH